MMCSCPLPLNLRVKISRETPTCLAGGRSSTSQPLMLQQSQGALMFSKGLHLSLRGFSVSGETCFAPSTFGYAAAQVEQTWHMPEEACNPNPVSVHLWNISWPALFITHMNTYAHTLDILVCGTRWSRPRVFVGTNTHNSVSSRSQPCRNLLVCTSHVKPHLFCWFICAVRFNFSFSHCRSYISRPKKKIMVWVCISIGCWYQLLMCRVFSDFPYFSQHNTTKYVFKNIYFPLIQTWQPFPFFFLIS